MGKRLTHAVLAAGLAVVLLSGTGATTASWYDSVEREPVTITSGRLSLDQGATTVVVVRTTDGTTQQLPATTPLLPGDVVRVTSTVTVRAQGDALRARLVLDRSRLGAVVDGVNIPASVTTQTALTAAGPDAWSVTGAADGATLTAVADLTVPATTDGRPPAADRSNWWGERLQRQTLSPGTIRWTITQETS